MNYLDLFSGIGGFHKGLIESGFKFNWTGHSEIDKYAKSIYKKHFPESEDLGCVSGINVSDLPGIDIITFGFPCQDLSVAGGRQGLSGRRSSLFYEAMRIIKVAKPKIFIFENVLGLYSSGDPKGGDFTAVLREISSFGLYDCEWQTLNTRWFLPQNRERIYFIGHLRGRSRPKVFPFGEGYEENTVSKEQIASCIDGNYHKGSNTGNKCTRTLIQVGNIDTKGHNSIWGRVYDPEGCSATLNAKAGGLGAKTGLYNVSAVMNPDFKSKDQNGRRTKEAGEPMFTLTGQDRHGIEVESRIRRLTPVECARLQGFPDNWCEGVSDTQKYKCLGNAVSVPVVAAIGERLLLDTPI